MNSTRSLTRLAALAVFAFAACTEAKPANHGQDASRTAGSDANEARDLGIADANDASAGGEDGAEADEAGAALDAGGAVDGTTADAAPGMDAGPGQTFTIAGTITFDWVEAKDSITEGGDRLDFGTIAARPARRLRVEAIQAQGGASVVETTTGDDGRYRLSVPMGMTVKVRVHAEIKMVSNVPDGIPPDNCSGATWNVVATDNTQQGAPYVIDGANSYTTDATNADVHAALVYNNGYRDRSAAPFAVLDDLVNEIELVCEGDPAPNLPILFVNWSINNTPSSGDPAMGMIGTSFYTTDQGGTSNLFLLGKEDVDTDEYDDHVVAHETGHYFEHRLYRADNLGGGHADGDTLDPTVAFGEGYGNGISGMTYDDPVYVDTSGMHQATGFDFDVSAPPIGDDRGIYSEQSSDYLLWSLYENRNTTPHSGSYDRIHAVLRNDQRTSEALTTLQTFASYYNQTYGREAEQLHDLWVTGIGTPYNALCAGACAGMGDTADPFDVDNDIGIAYATTRHYPQGAMGQLFGAEFWRMYRTLSSGANAATAHDQTQFGGSSDASNKFGGVRTYRFVGTGNRETVAISNLGASNCITDVLDISVLDHGVEIASDYSRSGCPTASFPTAAGASYVFQVFGYTTQIPSWTTSMTPKRGPPVEISSSLEGEVSPYATHEIQVRAMARGDAVVSSISIRGIDGAIVAGARAGQKTGEIAAAVRIPERTAGFVVADVQVSVGGKQYGTSKAFSVRAFGASPKRGGLGRLAEDARGKKIVILPSENSR